MIAELLGLLTDATLIAVVDIADVILTEPLFCLLSDEDVLFVLAQNSCTIVLHCIAFVMLFLVIGPDYILVVVVFIGLFMSVYLFLSPNRVMISLGVLCRIP